MMRVLAIAACVAGCAPTRDARPPTTPAHDDAPPTLEITAPARATITADASVTITGRARAAQVAVNGVVAPLDGAGDFAITLDLAPGTTIVETVARDVAGREVRDVRAVLAGATALVGGDIHHAAGARLGVEAIAALGDTVAGLVEELDLTALFDGTIASRGGSCLGYDVRLTEVDVGDVTLALAPVADALRVTATVADLDLAGTVDYRVGCFGGREAFRIHADSASADGTLGLAVVGSGIASAVRHLHVTVHGLRVDADDLPDAIDDLVADQLAARLPGLLETALGEALPSQIDQALGDLSERSYTALALDRAVAVTAHPAEVSIDDAGVWIALDAAIWVSGAVGGAYVASPATMTSAALGDDDGVSVAIADDLLNAVFAGLWQAGAFDREIPIGPGSIEISAGLPPTATNRDDGTIQLIVGDLLVSVAGASFALTVSTSLSVQVRDGRIQLSIDDTRARAQRLAGDAFDEAKLERLIEGLAEVAEVAVADALATIALPREGDGK